MSGFCILRPRRDLLGQPNPLVTSGNEVIAVDWKGLKDVDQINMDSTSSLHGSSLHRPSTEVSRLPSCPLPKGPPKDPRNHQAQSLPAAWSLNSLPKFQDNIPNTLNFRLTLL